MWFVDGNIDNDETNDGRGSENTRPCDVEDAKANQLTFPLATWLPGNCKFLNGLFVKYLDVEGRLLSWLS